MLKHYVIRGRRGNKQFEGVIATRMASDIVEHGPSETRRSKSPMRLADLRSIAEVKECPTPTLTATVIQMLNHKFVLSVEFKEMAARGRLLQLFQDVQLRYKRERERK